MAKKNSKSAKNNKVENAAVVVEQPKPTTPKLIVAQFLYGRWYVYFKGVAPKDNVGCGCKTAKSAMRYMLMLKRIHGAVISNNVWARLEFEAAKSAKEA